MDDKLTAKTAKFMSLENLYVYGSYLNAKQKHLGCKKVWGQSEATLQTGRRNQKV